MLFFLFWIYIKFFFSNTEILNVKRSQTTNNRKLKYPKNMYIYEKKILATREDKIPRGIKYKNKII